MEMKTDREGPCQRELKDPEAEEVDDGGGEGSAEALPQGSMAR